MITVSNLSKTYKDTTVLSIESLELSKGEIIGLVGNNGAGKTTFFSLLLDLIKPSTGHIENNQVRVDQSEAWKSTTAAFIDESFLIGYLTPEEYFSFIAGLRNINKADLDTFLNRFSTFFNEEILGRNKYIRDLSKGNQKKAGIVGTLIGKPELVILDEPFANLDPSTQIRLKKLISDEAEKHGTTFLISSHDLTHVTEVCDRIVLLEKGLAIKDIETTPETLKELESYFSN